MAGRTLIYIDPGFQVDFGHFTRWGGLIKEEATASKVGLLHFVNLDVPQEKAEELGLIRRFKYTAGLWEKEHGEALRDFHTKLDEILQDLVKSKTQNHYKVFMYTSHPLHLSIIAFLINKYSDILNGLSAHICLFYIDPEFCHGNSKTDEYESMLKRVSRLIELFDPGCLMTICTDSERTKQLYNPYFKRELKILPVPIESTYRTSKVKKSDMNERIVIGYIGQTTKRAGYDLIYQAYKRISTMEIFHNIEFKIKHTFREQLKDIYSQFLSESQNITHIDDFLSNEEYEKFSSNCDIILLPYSRKYYPCQSSGIVTEALLRNKIMIVPEDTWMSDQIRDYGSGATFISDDVESFVQAVVKVVNSFEYYKEKTIRGIVEYRNLHSCSNLFSEIGLKNRGLKMESKTNPIKSDSCTETHEELMIENVVLLQEKDGLIRQVRQKDSQIKNKDIRIKYRDDQIKNRDVQIKNGDVQIKNKDIRIKYRDDQIQAMKNSWSWRITAPLRWVGKNITQSAKKGA